MPNYTKTLIYKIYCKDINIIDFYIGHTTKFYHRKQQHYDRCNNEENDGYNFKLYKYIRENGGWNNWIMEIVEKYPCNNQNEALDRETYWWNELKPSLNAVCPKRSVKERYELNKEYINKEYRKNYREINGREKERQKIICECGCEITKGSLNRHLKTQKHLKYEIK